MRSGYLPIAPLLVVLLMVLLPPALALADAPVTRGPTPQGQGSVGTPPSGMGGPASGAVWRGVRELPLPAMPARGPSYAPTYTPMTQQGAESGPVAWLGRTLNPGNWILDAGMGIFAGIIKMFGGIMQKAVEAFLGTGSVLPSGCDNAATNFVFCTPAGLTYGHPGVQAVWAVLRSIAAGIVTILFTVRLGRMIIEGPRTLATEGKGLLLTFIFAMSFIQATGPICQLLVEFFNGISNLLLSRASLTFPSQDVGDLNIGSNILFLVLWIVILLLVLKSFARIVQIIILLAMAPIAGALLMDRSTSSRFRSWFEKLIELLLSQINLVIIFIVIAAILQPYQEQGAGDAFVGFLLSIVMMGMALSGKSAIGIAGAAISGSGGGIISFLRYQLAGNAMRGLIHRGGGAGLSRADHPSAGATDSLVQAAASGRERTAQDPRDVRSRAAGDPVQSAAAQRQAASSGATNVLSAGSFRLSDAGDGLSARRARVRYQAARHGAEGQPLLDARREQARMRATLMRQRAGELRRQGDTQGADALSSKARLHDRFARGRDIARPSRFTDADRTQRRQVHRQALAEVSGMHALERDALTHQIGQDEERLPILQRDLAMAGATGGNTGALHREQQELSERLMTNRARLQAITPREEGAPALATRQAAAALANERLPISLRSRSYALRHGTAPAASPFIKRIAGAPTQGAQDELAQSRAVAVKTAQTPVGRRPPIAAQRRRSDAGKRKQAGVPRSTPDGASSNGNGLGHPGSSEPARPSRARSQTIAMLRARKQTEPAGPHDPVPADTPRPGPRRRRSRRDDAES
jgi:hypothetical protein